MPCGFRGVSMCKHGGVPGIDWRNEFCHAVATAAIEQPEFLSLSIPYIFGARELELLLAASPSSMPIRSMPTMPGRGGEEGTRLWSLVHHRARRCCCPLTQRTCLRGARFLPVVRRPCARFLPVVRRTAWTPGVLGLQNGTGPGPVLAQGSPLFESRNLLKNR